MAYWYAGTWSSAEARDWADQMQHRWLPEGVGKRIAYQRSDSEPVGRGGLTWTELDGHRCLELGWLIREEYRHLGYATDIGQAGLDFAFDELGADEVVASRKCTITRRAPSRSAWAWPKRV